MNSLFSNFDLSVEAKPKVSATELIKKAVPTVASATAPKAVTNQSLFEGSELADFNIDLTKPKPESLAKKAAASDVTALDGRVTTAEDKITNLEAATATNTEAISDVRDSLNAFENTLGFTTLEDKTVAESINEAIATAIENFTNSNLVAMAFVHEDQISTRVLIEGTTLPSPEEVFNLQDYKWQFNGEAVATAELDKSVVYAVLVEQTEPEPGTDGGSTTTDPEPEQPEQVPEGEDLDSSET